jgi:hypothetical protein
VVATLAHEPVLAVIALYYAAATEILGHQLLDSFVFGRLLEAHVFPRCGT